jgi:hypothetical protein
VRVVMGGMRHGARREVSLVHLDGIAGVSLALDDAAKLVSVVGLYRQIFESEQLGGRARPSGRGSKSRVPGVSISLLCSSSVVIPRGHGSSDHRTE